MSTKTHPELEAALDLFEKTAADQNFDLDSLSEQELVESFQGFLQAIGESDDHGDPEGSDVTDKIAAAQNAIAFNEFVKAAAAQDVDLNQFDEDQLAALYYNWLSDEAPTYLQKKEAAAEYEMQLQHAVKVAQANLAEISVLGDHLGEVAANTFLAKIADAETAMADTVRSAASGVGSRLKGAGQAVFDAAKNNPVKAGLAGVGGLGLAAHQLNKRRKARQAASPAEKAASAMDARVMAILEAHDLI